MWSHVHVWCGEKLGTTRDHAFTVEETPRTLTDFAELAAVATGTTAPDRPLEETSSEPKIDERGRSYATGRRKDAVARRQRLLARGPRLRRRPVLWLARGARCGDGARADYRYVAGERCAAEFAEMSSRIRRDEQ